MQTTYRKALELLAGYRSLTSFTGNDGTRRSNFFAGMTNIHIARQVKELSEVEKEYEDARNALVRHYTPDGEYEVPASKMSEVSTKQYELTNAPIEIREPLRLDYNNLTRDGNKISIEALTLLMDVIDNIPQD